MSESAFQTQIPSPPSLTPKTGELFVKEGLITQQDISKVLSLQKNTYAMATNHRLFGILLCHLNLITPVDNYCVLYKYNKLFDLKEFLLSQNLPEQDISQVYKEAEKNDIPVITSLIRSRIISADNLQKALFHLYHIPCRSIRVSVYKRKKTAKLKKVISENSARQNRVIPLVIKDHTFVSGITSPQNLLYIQKLDKEHPQYRFKTVFIPFFDFKALFKTLYIQKNTHTTCFSKTNLPCFSETPDLSLSEKNGMVLYENNDPSLLMNFKTIVKNPETDLSSIAALYKRYEKLKKLISHDRPQDISHDRPQDRFVFFNEFIVESHQKLTRTFKCTTIEFSLKQEKGKILIKACPKKEII
ncbi:MAG: hypothetical protein R6U68_12055 [Desulfobacteraceae bacterium]